MKITVTIDDGTALSAWEYIAAKNGAADVASYAQMLVDRCGESYAAEMGTDRVSQIRAAIDAKDTAMAVNLAQGGALAMPDAGEAQDGK